MKRWDRSLHGTKCYVCHGTGLSYEQGDAHRSSGTIPCPSGAFQGHGFPTCYKGILKFSDYDIWNWGGERPPTPKTPHELCQYASGYALDLYCDHNNSRHGFDEFPHTFTGETFGECVKSARRRGWVIRTATRTATCPKCSGKRK